MAGSREKKVRESGTQSTWGKVARDESAEEGVANNRGCASTVRILRKSLWA